MAIIMAALSSAVAIVSSVNVSTGKKLSAGSKRGILQSRHRRKLHKTQKSCRRASKHSHEFARKSNQVILNNKSLLIPSAN
jgi:hypothetical protein